MIIVLKNCRILIIIIPFSFLKYIQNHVPNSLCKIRVPICASHACLTCTFPTLFTRPANLVPTFDPRPIPPSVLDSRITVSHLPSLTTSTPVILPLPDQLLPLPRECGANLPPRIFRLLHNLVTGPCPVITVNPFGPTPVHPRRS